MFLKLDNFDEKYKIWINDGLDHTLEWKTLIKMLIPPKLAYCFIIIVVVISLGVKQLFDSLIWLIGVQGPSKRRDFNKYSRFSDDPLERLCLTNIRQSEIVQSSQRIENTIIQTLKIFLQWLICNVCLAFKSYQLNWERSSNNKEQSGETDYGDRTTFGPVIGIIRNKL